MPRISDTITLGETLFKAVRPQNVTTPAQFRQNGVAMAVAKDLNLGVQTTKTANRMARRASASLTLPHLSVENVLEFTDRVDIKCRFDAVTPDAKIEAVLAEIAALILTPEFKALAKGEEQY